MNNHHDEVLNPVRSEIFGAERLMQHAQSLASAQTVTQDPKHGFNLYQRLKENKEVLFKNYKLIDEAVNQKQAITSAAEWLIDNFHIIEVQLKDIEEHLPIWFYKELPKLSDGPLKGYPRVYGLSWAFVAHTDSHFDPDLLIQFVRSYQVVQPLTIGELWATAITLRIVLIENLRVLSTSIVNSLQSRKIANQLADNYLGLDGDVSQKAEDHLHNLDSAVLKESFLVQLIQRLRHQDSSTSSALQWLNDTLLEIDLSADDIVSREHNKQSATNLTVRNIITSMRLILAFDWRDFFESVSLVNESLNVNPIFRAIDSATQDQYLHALEELAKGSNYSELEIAQKLISIINEYQNQSANPIEERQTDPGYYLISSGRTYLEQKLNFRPSLYRRVKDFYTNNAKIGYSSSISLLSYLVLSFPLLAGFESGLQAWAVLIFGLIAFPVASDIALALLNKSIVTIMGPQHLPRIELKKGIPEDLATFIVMPILLINRQVIEEHLQQLEVHYLSNPEGRVYFALLADWKDSDIEKEADDQKLLSIATEGIYELNNRYHHETLGQKYFFVFHRARLWNASENKWMGYERKRGKLHEFNLLLRGNTNTSYINSKESIPSSIKYILTLDADTQMPIGMVAKLVGTMAHPLNKAHYDEVSKRVTEGYGILQPRVIAALPSRTNSSIFQKLFSGLCGMDPYSFASSDVYQDLFREGTYIGKGIYDIDAFEASLAGRIPENALLSHDLFEGNFARCGFVSNIDLYEDYPSHVEVAAARADRWARGDWQLLPWLLGPQSHSTPLIGRWKMLDNLRRSVVAPSMILTLIMAWFWPDAPYIYWTGFIIFALAFPLFLPAIATLVNYPHSKSFGQVYLNLKYELAIGFQQTLCLLSLLLHYAINMCDAIFHTLLRLFITKRKLLQWLSSAQQKIKSQLSLRYFLKEHEITISIALILGFLLWISAADLTLKLIASPIISLWLCSAFIARYISLPPKIDPSQILNPEEKQSLRLIARQTWRFFTHFATENDNFLPPDNFQETPSPVIAHRGSPTNFGLYLLSIIAAKDFGWLGLESTISKLESALEVLVTLPRYKGHFYNWYDLPSKQPLYPQYISSVDSGNLAAYLLVSTQTCKEFTKSTLQTLSKTEGFNDSLELMQKALQLKKQQSNLNFELLEDAISQLAEHLQIKARTGSESLKQWQSIEKAATTLVDISRAFTSEHLTMDNNNILLWAEETYTNIKSQAKDIKRLLFWSNACQKLRIEVSSNFLNRQLDLLDSQEAFELTLIDLATHYSSISNTLQRSLNATESSSLAEFIMALEESSQNCKQYIKRLESISSQTQLLFDEMDFGFLYDSSRKLFSIGFNVSENALDPAFYDLLASEARLTSFISVAKAAVPVNHWLSLGRTLTPLKNGAALVSWSGSMFEYLMPSLVMHTPRGSLLDKTCRLIIERQIQYGDEQKVPWGVSESAYNTRDLNSTYQYSSFGVPGLGLKRGIAQDLVISPYATALAAMYYPKSALDNFKKLEGIKSLGVFGFYEAIDFTATRIPENKAFAIVQTYMAHHQGMSLIALDNVIFHGIMRHRFHNIPMIRAAELLLQERTPHAIAIEQAQISQNEKRNLKDLLQPSLRRFGLPNLNIPTTHFLSNGHYTVMLSTAGSGYSSCNDIAITRWREDATTDNYGSYIFLYDTATKQSWSAGFQPSAIQPDRYEVIFTEDKAKIIREDNGLITTLEIVVSAEDNAEIRRLTIKNTSLFTKEIEVTSYNEVVLAPQATDIMHPAFSNLFVETEYVAKTSTLLASRRPRSNQEQILWMAHTLAVDIDNKVGLEYETDRMRFLGRGRSVREAVAISEGQPLSNTVGAVLDPILSLRSRVIIPPGTSRTLQFSTIVSHSREGINNLADKYHDLAIFERASSLAWTYAQAQLHHLAIDDSEANLFQQLASNIIYSNPAARPPSAILQRSTLNVTGLWGHQISGDKPIVLVHIDSPDDIELINQLLRAQEYWRLKHLSFDLIIINEKANSYIQDLQTNLETIARTSLQTNVFVLRADLLASASKDLIESSARVVMLAKEGGLANQLARINRRHNQLVYDNKRPNSPTLQNNTLLPVPDLEFFNGLGGFANEGRDYVIVLNKLQYTPAPWINIIANSKLGFIVSESGSTYTWSLNSRENQISPWSNDPVIDPSGEVFYIQDEESKEFWTPTALPIRCENTSYITSHGQGYSNFEHLSHGIESSLTQFVSYEDPIKISRLVLKNLSNKTRRLSLTAYIELVLGSSRAINAPYIVTEWDQESQALLAYNPWSVDFSSRISFATFTEQAISWTTDRTEFIGRNGNLKQPASLVQNKTLESKSGAGLDPCFVEKIYLEIPANSNIELKFFLGQTDNRELARELIRNYKTLDLDLLLKDIKSKWDKTLGKIQVQTPDRATDLILNRWALYQTLVCRYWARTAFYQAGGAYGFRDQLQDVMALTLTCPDITRTQILRAAAHQFPEGDVQHWWHPPTNKGVRTHCSDDSLWLPYVLHHYIQTTGDYQILDEKIHFIEGRLLGIGEESSYYEPQLSQQHASLYEHCKRILDRSLRVGLHGLPLIGSGDWNDGMNLVGHKGLGESVWLGWFTHTTLGHFASLIKDPELAENYLKHALDLQKSLEENAWDGAWYKRAYFDDGTALGSAANAECRIDSIAQSWSVISQAADRERSSKAMDSVAKYLVKTGDDLILLFTPPFDKSNLDPGYIKGYLPGIRENGAQYTHAAIWNVIAFAMLGNGNKAYELFSMLNPINHASTRAGTHKYKVEPYVLAADIYSEPPHIGRGGWTWYTGSAAWFYRAGIESILGLKVTGKFLWMDPCIPEHWPCFTIDYQHGLTSYKISVTNSKDHCSKGIKTMELDGQELIGAIPLVDDGLEHQVYIRL